MFEFDKGIDASKEMILFERFMKFLNTPPFLVDSCDLGIIACGITARQIDFTLRVIKLVGPEHVAIPAKLVLDLIGERESQGYVCHLYFLVIFQTYVR